MEQQAVIVYRTHILDNIFKIYFKVKLLILLIQTN